MLAQLLTRVGKIPLNMSCLVTHPRNGKSETDLFLMPSCGDLNPRHGVLCLLHTLWHKLMICWWWPVGSTGNHGHGFFFCGSLSSCPRSMLACSISPPALYPIVCLLQYQRVEAPPDPVSSQWPLCWSGWQSVLTRCHLAEMVPRDSAMCPCCVFWLQSPRVFPRNSVLWISSVAFF